MCAENHNLTILLPSLQSENVLEWSFIDHTIVLWLSKNYAATKPRT